MNLIDKLDLSHQLGTDDAREIQASLLAWRKRALYIVLLLVTVAGLPAFIFPVLNAIRTNAMTPLLWVYLVVYVGLVVLALVPRLDLRVRGWGAILLAYAIAIASFARVGLAGSGRLYLLTLPIIATMVIGMRAGTLAAGLSLAIYVAFAALAQAGWLANWITVPKNPVDLGFWIEAGAALAIFVMLLIALLHSFYRLYIRTLAARQEATRQLEQTAQKLREREERLALVIEGTDDGIWDWNLKTDDVYFSPLWKSMLGYADHEIANRFEEWRRLIHPEDVGRAISTVQAYLEGRIPVFELEHRLQHKDGSYRWILARARALRDAEGKPYRMAGSHIDITQRKRADEILRQSEKRFAQVFRASPLPISITSLENGVYVDVNDAWLRLFDYQRDQVIGNTSLQLNIWVRPEQRAGMIQQLQTTGSLRDYEHLARTKTGQIRDVRVSAEIIELNNERYNLALVRDITESKRIQAELRRREKRFRELIENSSDGIRLIGANGEILYLSPSNQRILGYADEELLGRSTFDLIHPDDLEDLQNVMDDLRQSPGATARTTYRMRHKDGSWRWIESAGTNLLTEADVQAFVVNFRDITEEIEAQKELQQAYQTLEQRVKERTRELSEISSENARLYRAERERHAESEQRREVAEGMRDILNILNSNRPLPEILDYIVKQASRLLSSDAGLISRIDPESQFATCEASVGLPPEVIAMASGPLSETSGNRALMEHKAVGHTDLPAYVEQQLNNPDARVTDLYRERYQILARLYQSLLAVPLTIKGITYGTLLLYYRSRREFGEEDLRLGLALADQIALAIENAQLRDQIMQTAAISERSRLARELHDSVTQSLYSMTLYAEAAARLLANGKTAEAGDHLREVRDTAQEALREMRLLIFELRPLALETSGLAAALQARLDAVETRGGVHAKLEVVGQECLTPAVEQELYHIAQEALNNTLKHAHAQNVSIHLEFSAAMSCLEIYNDGVPFDLTTAAESGGLGLRGMKERAEKIGAQLEIESDANRTRVRVQVPSPK